MEKEQLEFYPQFCLRCQQSWISKLLSEPCIYCGSRRTVNHLREVLGDDESSISNYENEVTND